MAGNSTPNTAGAPTATAGSAGTGASGLGAMGGGISLGAGLISAIGSMYQGQTTANALDAQANLADQNAQEAEAQGQFNAMKEQMLAGIKIGSISANYGASGVKSTSGSAEAVIAASTSNSELDRLNILHGADVRSIMYQNQASMDRVGATSALTGATFSGIGSIVKGGMTAAAFGIAASPQTTNPMAGATPVSDAASYNPSNPGAYNATGGINDNDFMSAAEKNASIWNLNKIGRA